MSERNDELPLGWAEARLDDLGEWQGGGTPSKSRSAFWTNGNVPWVSPKDMKTFYIDDTEDHITDEAVVKSAAKLLQPSSVLVVTRSGILQRTLPVAINRVSVTTNQDLSVTVLSRVQPHASIVQWVCIWVYSRRGDLAAGRRETSSRHGDHDRGSS